MVIKISCKYIKDNAFDITVGQETRTITHENNQSVFKLSESKNYNIEICKKSCKSNHSFSNILIFFFHYDIARHFQYSIDEHRFKVV